ncbi:MAG: diphosphomevalonate decarboxylase [Myxococcales bacterium]|nr:diphosphomevalonate decarboxylase [Myxococcales bacterium]
MKASFAANANIALVKYWGKRDEGLILPHQSSFSVTLGGLSVTATVAFGMERDEVVVNGAEATGEERARVIKVLDAVRAGLGFARVETRGNFPKAVGLASSAAAFAAIAVAARAAAGSPRDEREESILARLGSGSACRSVRGGFCLWRRGQRSDGLDSYARQLFPAEHWPQLRLVVALLERKEKRVKSREGMRRTVETSPYYSAWVQDAEEEAARAVESVRRKDLAALGALSERNALRMHAAAMGADPPLCYLAPATLRVIEAVADARERGVPVWFTLDAGPNPVLLTEASREEDAKQLARAAGAREVIACGPGGDPAPAPELF